MEERDREGWWLPGPEWRPAGKAGGAGAVAAAGVGLGLGGSLSLSLQFSGSHERLELFFIVCFCASLPTFFLI
jgi:hypothetical protein